MNDLPLITLMTFIPLFGGGILWCFGGGWDSRKATRIGTGIGLLPLAVGFFIGLRFDPEVGTIQNIERHRWIPALNVDYFVGVDGLSLLMVGLTALLAPVALSTAREASPHPHRFAALILFLEAGLIGVFTALNFFHWFLFWELSLIPAFFLIRLWGNPRQSEAAIPFFLYTFVGSIALLLSFLALFAATGTFDFAELAEQAKEGELMSRVAANLGWKEDVPPQGIGLLLFGMAFFGVAVKVPIYPFHTWAPAAYAAAPDSVTLLLTGAMSKMGLYALLRLILPIFPDQAAQAAAPLLILAVGTIVLSALAACVQTDLRRIFAYSSINHLGYCLLGAFAVMSGRANDSLTTDAAAAINGVGLHMFNHGVVAGLIFFLLGRLESRAGGLRGIGDFGGLRSITPRFAAVAWTALLASLGLPGLNAFVGEFLIFKGAFAHVQWATALASLGLLLTAVFLLNVIQKVFAGPPNEKWRTMPDLNPNEWLVVAPALALIISAGVYPQYLLRFLNETSLHWLAQIGKTP